MKEYKWNAFGYASNLACEGIRGTNPQVFPAWTKERGHFFVFFQFLSFGLQNLQNIQANPCGFIKKGPPNKYVKFH